MGENIKDNQLSRRDFLKVAAGTAFGVMIASAGLSGFGQVKQALASGGEPVAVSQMQEGVVYSISVNLVVPAGVHQFLSLDAVITDTTTPSIIPFRRPTTYQVDNGTITKLGANRFQVAVDTFNNTFGLLEIDSASSDGRATITERRYKPWNVAGNSTRIDGLTVTLTDPVLSGDGKNRFVFAAREYANFLFIGEKNFPVTLVAEFNSIKRR